MEIFGLPTNHPVHNPLVDVLNRLNIHKGVAEILGGELIVIKKAKSLLLHPDLWPMVCWRMKNKAGVKFDPKMAEQLFEYAVRTAAREWAASDKNQSSLL